jgi:hypothetical protein
VFREQVMVREALGRDPEEAAALVQALLAATTDPARGRRYREWLAQVLYLQVRPREAAALQLGVAAEEPARLRRATARLNAGSALADLDDVDAAEACLRDALEDARGCRVARLEAFALTRLRTLAYRRRAPLAPNPELRAAVALLDVPRFEAEVLLTDAATAWRLGDSAAAAALATQAGAAYRRAGLERGYLLAAALHVAASGADEDALRLAKQALALGPPQLYAQVVAWCGAGGWGVPEDHIARVESAAREEAAERMVWLDRAEVLQYASRRAPGVADVSLPPPRRV